MNTPCFRCLEECEVCSEVFGSVLGEAFGTLTRRSLFSFRCLRLGMDSVGGRSAGGSTSAAASEVLHPIQVDLVPGATVLGGSAEREGTISRARRNETLAGHPEQVDMR